MVSPPPLLLEFLRSSGDPVTLADLGLEFLEANGLPMSNAVRPFRVEVEPRQSKKGNTYYSYEHAKVPLPDGLDTLLRVGGEVLDFGPPRLSQAGNLTREGRARITHHGLDYDVLAYLTEGSKPYWIKVHAQKAPGKKPTKPGLVGGRIV